MSVTLTDIAKKANVSIATVSNVLNKTKYVSPELVKKIEDIANELGYTYNNIKTSYSIDYKVGKLSEIAIVIPNINSPFFSEIVTSLSFLIEEKGYLFSVYVTNDNFIQEKRILLELIANRKIAGVILCPTLSSSKKYKKFIKSNKPSVCLERTWNDFEIETISSDNEQGISKGVEHLIKCGHEKIALILEDYSLNTTKERKMGYLKILDKYNINSNEKLILEVDIKNLEISKEEIKKLIKTLAPTAIMAASNSISVLSLKAIKEMGLKCPKDISVVGFGDGIWAELISPPLTALKRDIELISKKLLEILLIKLNNNHNEIIPLDNLKKIPMNLNLRDSTVNIARGPFGEKVVYPEENLLSIDEIERIKNSNYTVAISFHYMGNEWSRLHEKAIKETLSNLNVRILSSTDANFDPNLQNTQLEGLLMQKPDAIIAVPTDEILTAKEFKKVAKETKLVLINNIPNGLIKEDYASWISVNERENGQIAVKILKDYFKKQSLVKIGLLIHGSPFFATKQRDFFAEQTLIDNCSNIEIVAKEAFLKIDNAYNVCKKMIIEHPEIQGLYVSWDRPALQAIKALKEMGREDVVISTTDLDYEIASFLNNEEIVIGLSSQRPYEQGVAVAIATAKALLGDTINKCIGVPPYIVTKDNMELAWKELLKSKMPSFQNKERI